MVGKKRCLVAQGRNKCLNLGTREYAKYLLGTALELTSLSHSTADECLHVSKSGKTKLTESSGAFTTSDENEYGEGKVIEIGVLELNVVVLVMEADTSMHLDDCTFVLVVSARRCKYDSLASQRL